MNIEINDYHVMNLDAENAEAIIPAASTKGIDLAQIRVRYPEAAQEIEEIGTRLDMGEDTEADLLCLGQLLFDVGEVDSSEDLLRCNIVESGDAIHDLYIRLHGTSAERQFEAVMKTFASLFNLHLEQEASQRYLQCGCRAAPSGNAHTVNARIITDMADSGEGTTKAATTVANWMKGPSRVDFLYDSLNQIRADVTSASPDRERPTMYPEAEYCYSFLWRDGQWRLDTQ